MKERSDQEKLIMAKRDVANSGFVSKYERLVTGINDPRWRNVLRDFGLLDPIGK